MSAERETLLKFPCHFIIKVIGRGEEQDFQKVVLPIVQRHFPSLNFDDYATRPSRHKNYSALHIEVYAKSKEQLDAVYQELNSCDAVIMVL